MVLLQHELRKIATRLCDALNRFSPGHICTNQVPYSIRIVLSFFKKWANTCLFSVYFRRFKQTTNQWEKLSCPSSIWRQDLNPRPRKDESSPITTRSGLPQMVQICWYKLTKHLKACSKMQPQFNCIFATAQRVLQNWFQITTIESFTIQCDFLTLFRTYFRTKDEPLPRTPPASSIKHEGLRVG